MKQEQGHKQGGQSGKGRGGAGGGKQKQPPPFRFKGLKLLGFVAVLYGLAFVLSPDQAMASVQRFGHVLGTLVPILLVVWILTALINRFLSPEDLARHLGEDSGLRGWMIALGAGVISHGPMYAWYPMIQDLREQGARDGLIIAFFYARAVKVALLPMMVIYFGLTFTVALTVLTLLAAWVQGAVADRLSR
jgi:uncharacterized membrane protein YraQ (UPF0718 family)